MVLLKVDWICAIPWLMFFFAFFEEDPDFPNMTTPSYIFDSRFDRKSEMLLSSTSARRFFSLSSNSDSSLGFVPAPACPRIRTGALTTHGEIPTVPQSSVAANIHKSFDIELDFSPEVSLNPIVILHYRSKSADLIFSQSVHSGTGIDICFFKYSLGSRPTYTIDICQTCLNPLFTWQLNSSNSSHNIPPRSVIRDR
jgi:hypothetical protein